MLEKIKRVQKILKTEKIDGWLIYDYQGKNSLAAQFLELPSSVFLTRRIFYWIPAEGAPIRFVNAVEDHVLDSLPGALVKYDTWISLEQHLKKTLQNASRITMEYSPRGAIPAVSFVDGGTLEWIKEMVSEVVSSSSFIQEFICTFSDFQKQSHLEAAGVLEKTAEAAWEFIAKHLQQNKKITEFDVRQFMAAEIKRQDCLFESGPICAVNANSSNPHYMPTSEKHSEIKKGDSILIDLWCKKNATGAVYADISRVAVADTVSSALQEELFNVVRQAQKAATDLVIERFQKKKSLRGWEVDQAARGVIEKNGYGQYFIHRTGHNIYTEDHGPGTHMDSMETYDDRLVMAGTCFSIEPGIYLPGKLGVRLEYDLFVSKEGNVEINGGIQEEVRTLF